MPLPLTKCFLRIAHALSLTTSTFCGFCLRNRSKNWLISCSVENILLEGMLFQYVFECIKMLSMEIVASRLGRPELQLAGRLATMLVLRYDGERRRTSVLYQPAGVNKAELQPCGFSRISRQNFDGTQLFAVAFLVQKNVRSTAFIHLRGRDRHCYAKCFHGFQRLMRQRPLTPNTCKSPTRWSRPRCGPMLIPRQDTARHPHPPPDRARSRAG